MVKKRGIVRVSGKTNAQPSTQMREAIPNFMLLGFDADCPTSKVVRQSLRRQAKQLWMSRTLIENECQYPAISAKTQDTIWCQK